MNGWRVKEKNFKVKQINSVVAKSYKYVRVFPFAFLDS
jgi:hypothetical protein